MKKIKIAHVNNISQSSGSQLVSLEILYSLSNILLLRDFIKWFNPLIVYNTLFSFLLCIDIVLSNRLLRLPDSMLYVQASSGFSLN
jgi:hypothetical protein